MTGFEWQIRHELLIYSNYPCHIYNLTFWDVQTSTPNRFHLSTGRFAKIFLSFLTQNRPKVNEAPCRYVNISLMQSNHLNLIKISKSCSKVIQRTLRSGKNWLRYSSFSAISRVKWKRDQIFEHIQSLQLTLAKHDNVSKKEFARQKSLKQIVMDCARQSRFRICNSYLKKFSWRNFFCCLKVGILPVKHHFWESSFAIFFQILVDHLPVLESPPNFRVKWTSPNSGLEMWQGFCHSKIISYKNIPSKMPFYPSN